MTFCHLGLSERVPDLSTFSKNRHGRFRDSELLCHLFETTVARCIKEGLVSGQRMSTSRPTHSRIFNSLLESAALAFLFIAIGRALPTKNRLENLEFQAQTKAASHAAASLRVSVSSLIAREWASLGSFGELVDVDDPASARQVSDAANKASTGILWAGVVGLDGIVIAGSDGLREGEDVSSYGWFKSGLHGVRVGGVYTPMHEGDDIGQRFNMSRRARTPWRFSSAFLTNKVMLVSPT